MMNKAFTKILTAFFYLSLTSMGTAQTNVYHPFPNDTAYWGLNTSMPGCSSSPCPYERIFQMGDTVVNAILYHKVYSQWGTFGPPSNCGGTGTSCYTPNAPLALKCFLRQDSAAKKVYVAIPPGNQDTLLYNFDLHPGDTLPKTYASSGMVYPSMVQKIDSILINGHYNKTFIFDTNNTSTISYLVEGVGSSHDLLNLNYCLNGCQWVDCFDNNPVQFGGGSFFCGGYAVAGIGWTNHIDHLQISPNPTSGMVQMDLPENSLLVRVSDVCGKEVKCFGATGQNIKLDLGELENGLYLVEVISGEGRSTQKIMINR